jgi:hypothetical protein
MMTNKTEKEWTVLIYANGNNDLEPEMWQAVSNLTKVASHSDIHVAIQAGRANQRLVKLLRKNHLPKSDDSWIGVRRYFLEDNELHLVDQLGKVNMADPRRLYDFIKWGMQACPAKHYMLIVGGHGYQFVGTMTDYTQKAPYIMGIPEMIEAINKGANDSDGKIDILVMDICYFNFIEVIYELGKDENHAVQNAITYIFNGPVEGLPYNKMIELLQKNKSMNNTKAVTQNIVEELSYDLVAVSINHLILNKIKQQFNEYAFEYCAQNTSDGQTDISAILKAEDKSTNTIIENILSLIIQYKRVSQSNAALLATASKQTSDPDLVSRYSRLSFAQQNYWTYLLSKKGYDVNTVSEQNKNLLPLKLRPKEVYAFISIMNPGLKKEQKEEVLKDLYRKRKWKFV